MTFSSPRDTARSVNRTVRFRTDVHLVVCQALEDVRKKRKELNEEAKVVCHLWLLRDLGE